MLQLATHGVAARVVELALQYLKPSLTIVLRLELYGKESPLFPDEIQAAIKTHMETQAQQTTDDNIRVLGTTKHTEDRDGSTVETSEGNKRTPVTSRPTLNALVSIRPLRKEVVMSNMSTLVGKFFQKGLLPFQYAQDILCEFLEECDQTQFDEQLPLVVENAMVLLSTRSGTKAVCLAIARGGAKERRRLLKVLKGQSLALLTHRDAYLAVMMACEVTDDTVAVQKSLLADLVVKPTAEEIAAAEQFSANPFLDDGVACKQNSDMDEDQDNDGIDDRDASMEEDTQDNYLGTSDDDMREYSSTLGEHMPLLDVALSWNGSKLLLWLIAGINDERFESSIGIQGTGKKYLDPEELKVLFIPSPTSKKNPSVRREELLAYLKEPLLDMISCHAKILLTSRSGSAIVVETLRCFSISNEGQISEGMSQVSSAITALAEVSPVVYEHSIAHLALKKILLNEASANASMFASALAEKVGGSVLGMWAASSNRGAFIVLALLQISWVKSNVALLEELDAKRSEIARKVEGASSSKEKSRAGVGGGAKRSSASEPASLVLTALDQLTGNAGKDTEKQKPKAKLPKKKAAGRKK